MAITMIPLHKCDRCGYENTNKFEFRVFCGHVSIPEGEVGERKIIDTEYHKKLYCLDCILHVTGLQLDDNTYVSSAFID